MKFEAIHEQRADYPLYWMCRKLNVSRAGYYAWQSRPESKRDREDAELTVQIRAFHQGIRKTYGSPRILDDLRDDGRKVGRNRVIKLMRREGLSGSRKRRYVHTTNSNHDFPIAENLLQRDFHADGPNQKWVGDITYVRTHAGWVYLAVLMDLFSRKIVGWAVSDSMSTDLPLRALKMALIRRRPEPGLVHHTDRGAQYASTVYREALKESGLICSMSRRADCWDNAPGESVFGRIKDDLVYRRNFESKKQAMAEIEDYIENFYNPVRRHSAAGRMSPNDYEAARLSGNQAA